ncbi:MAG TPA: glycoside hydrolase 100 family protein [Dissulfurispiraceae bacterium]|nr:glycoside hydrolase 100 family protein [Dissulfurispiraceae bacterium]
MKRRNNVIEGGPDLVQECYARAVALLRENSSPSGVIACAKSEKSAGRHYASIFGRDAAICALGMVASRDPELTHYARNSLLTLARYQAPNGQIPKYVKPEVPEVDFWYAGCIDATLWWLIAVRFYDRFGPRDGLLGDIDSHIESALHWLFCQEHQGLFLLQQNEASDWADIMPRSGFVLYSNALWCYVKRLYRIPTADETRYHFRTLFYPFDKTVPEHRRARILVHYVRSTSRQRDFYLSFVNFSYSGQEVDVFGNVLTALLGIAPASQAARMAERLIALGVDRPFPVKVVLNPIRKNSRLWRSYMLRHRQNLPYQYHNGGIWPFVGCFWVMMLAKLRREKEAWSALRGCAAANSVDGWAFNEWLHGRTGKPMGMAGQSWNAATFILACRVLEDRTAYLT